MPVQQIVYHMLRVFVKTARLADSGNNSEACVLSNYHIKTLMMWACELKSTAFWTDDLNLVRIGVELLHTLSVWLTDTRCQHYFINSCNLIDKTVSMKTISSQLNAMDSAWLSTWFVNYYMQKCFALYPDNVSSLFGDISTSTKLQNTVSAVIRWRLNMVMRAFRKKLRHCSDTEMPDRV